MQSASVDSEMKPASDPDYTRKMIHCMMEMQDDILKIPELTSKQEDDIIRLRERLQHLDLQTDDTKIKFALIDVMNSLD